MKVLVTGANGLLGSHVVRELLIRNYCVCSMVREGCNRKALEDLKCEYFEGKITNRTDVGNAVKNCDFVIHVAARTSQKSSDLGAFFTPNIQSTQYLIEACNKFSVKRFVFVSTANCFGNGSKSAPGDEQKPFLPWLKKSGYAYSKFLAQQLVLGEFEKNKLDLVIVNPTFIIGQNDVKPSSGAIFSYVVNKQVVFYPPGGKNFVDARVAAKGVINAMEKGNSGECYLLAGENLSYAEFFKKVTVITGARPVFIAIPAWLLKGLGFIGDLIESLFKRPVQLTGSNARMLCTENYYTAKKAINEIDYKVIPIDKSIEKALQWFKKNHYFNLN